MKLTKSIVNTRVLLFLGIFVFLNLLASELFFRLDFTADGRYTLSNSTKEILRSLSDQVTVTAYFSDNLPPQLENIKTDFMDMLVEYASYANGNLVYEFISPEDEAEKQRILQSGVAQIEIQSREEDNITVQLGFMGALIKMGGEQEPLPRISNQGMEYALSTGIKKLSVKEKTKVGLVVGHGEAGLDRLTQAMPFLQIQYELDTISLAEADAWANYKTLVILKPTETYPPDHLTQLNQFLASGGRLLIGLDAVQAELNQQSAWDRLSTGLENWLNTKGVMVEQSFLIDAQCNQILIQRVQNTPFGRMNVQQPILFPFFPVINNFEEHPITNGLEQMIMLFPSPISLTGVDSTVRAGALVRSSEKSGKLPAPTFFNPERNWTEQDFPSNAQNLAVWLEGKFGGENEAKMIVVGDGDFPLDQQQMLRDNVNLLVNSLDWLTDDTGLIELRNKGVAARPFDQQLEPGTRTFIKTLNFLLPILIVIGFGIYRWQRRRMQQLRWEAQDFS